MGEDPYYQAEVSATPVVDSLYSGGNDTQIIDSVSSAYEYVSDNEPPRICTDSDRIIDYFNEGVDTIESSIDEFDYHLASNAENLTLTGSGDIGGGGNTLNNTIIGNPGNNRLYGDQGNDTINVHADFGGGLTGGAAITAAQFRIGTAAGDKSFIYDKFGTGAMFFDPDGNTTGGSGQLQFAQLSTGLAMTNLNIFVFA